MASSSLLDSFKNTVKNLELPLQKSFLFTVVLGLKQLVNKAVFECPECHYTLHSLLFIIVPAVGLLCLALMISRSFWKMATGSCFLSKYRRGNTWKRSRHFVYLCSLPPVAWLFLVFLDKKYYVCSKLGPVEVRLRQEEILSAYSEKYFSEKPVMLSEFHSAETESQIIAFLLLAAIIVFATIVISVDRCCTKAVSSIANQEDYAHHMAEEQIRLFNSKIKQLAHKAAKEQVEAAFEESESEGEADKIRLISEVIERDFPWAKDEKI